MSETQTPKTDGSGAVTDLIVGVFSTKVVSQVDTGGEKRKALTLTYFYAEENDTGEVELQAINSNHIPTGPLTVIPKQELLKRYDPEPEFYTDKVFPQIRSLEKTLARAERYRKRGQHFSAEFEFGNALKLDEQNVRATFGIGMCYMDRGEKDKAEDILQRLVKLPAAFEERHKHLFNEFGINLRKQKMHEEAVEYYTRALDFTENDENLFYNLARAAFELGDYETTVKHLKQCLTLDKQMEPARKLAAYMKKKGLLGKGKKNGA